jgi:hypothetical protein
MKIVIEVWIGSYILMHFMATIGNVWSPALFSFLSILPL